MYSQLVTASLPSLHKHSITLCQQGTHGKHTPHLGPCPLGASNLRHKTSHNSPGPYDMKSKNDGRCERTRPTWRYRRNAHAGAALSCADQHIHSWAMPITVLLSNSHIPSSPRGEGRGRCKTTVVLGGQIRCTSHPVQQSQTSSAPSFLHMLEQLH